jgi:hypothetical protein
MHILLNTTRRTPIEEVFMKPSKKKIIPYLFIVKAGRQAEVFTTMHLHRPNAPMLPQTQFPNAYQTKHIDNHY